jgi:membrane-associated PAP2 superfamily phosphatase
VGRADPRRAGALAAVTLLCVLAVPALKQFSHTSCPWDLAEFGGVARYVSATGRLGVDDGGPGRCFPSGHATAAFAFFGGWFVLRDHQPAGGAPVAGRRAAGRAGVRRRQYLRGAHYPSHTLWTAWLCWLISWLALAPPWRTAPLIHR